MRMMVTMFDRCVRARGVRVVRAHAGAWWSCRSLMMRLAMLFDDEFRRRHARAQHALRRHRRPVDGEAAQALGAVLRAAARRRAARRAPCRPTPR